MADAPDTRPAPPEPTLAQPGERPASPCINVCQLGADGFCIGCLRTGDEIGRWMAMSADEQWRLLTVLAERRKMQR